LTFIFFASCYRRADRCYDLPFLTLLSTKSNRTVVQERFKPVADVKNVLLRAANGMSVSDELQQLPVYDDLNCRILAAHTAGANFSPVGALNKEVLSKEFYVSVNQPIFYWLVY